MSEISGKAGKVRWLPWLMFPGVIILWGTSIVLVQWLFPEIEERGQFGDSLGGVNALFAGLAFAGVIWAIILQQKELVLQRAELALQRAELEKTREEIKGQKEQLAAQNQTLQQQSFESSFFQLLGLHNDIVNSMAIPQSHHGRECFIFLFKELTRNDAYEKFFAEYQPVVGHYFRHLYNVVKFVDQSDFSFVELNDQKFEALPVRRQAGKKFYTNLVRAQLSSSELGLLFYTCLSDRGAKFKVFVERYALLENMPLDVLINKEHRKLYDKRAYGEAE